MRRETKRKLMVEKIRSIKLVKIECLARSMHLQVRDVGQGERLKDNSASSRTLSELNR